MEMKTKITAEDGQQSITITREFGLPAELLFKAHVEADIFEQWMSHEYGTTKVVKWNATNHGDWRFETRGVDGSVLFAANGVFHALTPQQIIRTFEMETGEFGVQLDFISFEKLSEETSRLTIYSVYKTVEIRDALLKLPFAQGLNMAHNRLQAIIGQLK